MHYQNNFLTKTIFRVDFPSRPILAIAQPSEFSRRVAAVFPLVTAKPLSQIQIEVTTDGAGINTLAAGIQLDHAKTANGTVNGVLGPTFLALEGGPRDYTSFEAFFADFQVLFQALEAVYPTARPERIGLRYINEITGDGEVSDWSGEIAENISIASRGIQVDGARLLRSMNQTILKKDENLAAVHFGTWNPDFPNPAVRKHIVIDIDCYRENVDANANITECINSLNTLATDIFESMIGDDLRTRMVAINE